MDAQMLKLFNDQYNLELQSCLLYFAMSNHAKYYHYCGLAAFFEDQAMEEAEHAEKFKKFILKTGNKPVMNFSAQDVTFSNMKEAFQKALAHEKKISNHINSIVTTKEQKKYHFASKILNYFLDEQLEEEHKYVKMIKKVDDLGVENVEQMLYEKYYKKPK